MQEEHGSQSQSQRCSPNKTTLLDDQSTARVREGVGGMWYGSVVLSVAMHVCCKRGGEGRREGRAVCCFVSVVHRHTDRGIMNGNGGTDGREFLLR